MRDQVHESIASPEPVIVAMWIVLGVHVDVQVGFAVVAGVPAGAAATTATPSIEPQREALAELEQDAIPVA